LKKPKHEFWEMLSKKGYTFLPLPNLLIKPSANYFYNKQLLKPGSNLLMVNLNE